MTPMSSSPDALSLSAVGKGLEADQPTASSVVPWVWHPWSVTERCALLLMLSIVTFAAVPRLPTGICHADSGGFQLAAATLGITHPPGYAGYVTLWHLLTRVFGGDPAYVVAVSCLVAGLGVLTLLTMFQVRLGVNIWMACAVSLLFTAHPRVWSNFLAPEIYMLSLLFVISAAYMLLRYSRLGRRTDLFIAAFLYGVAIANRLPYILLLPFILSGWWIARRRWESGVSAGVKTIALCALLAVIPVVYNFAYLWILDTPRTSYNYLEHFNADTRLLPPSAEGPAAKLRRVLWHQSGEQFRDLLIWHPRNDVAENTWSFKLRQMYAKTRWIVQDTLPDSTMSLGMLWIFLAVAASAVRRRARAISLALTAIALVGATLFGAAHLVPALADSPLAYYLIASKWFVDLLLIAILFAALLVTTARHSVAGLLLIGLASGAIVYVCIYRVHGLAADMLPLLFVVAVMIGVILSSVFPQQGSRGRNMAAFAIMLLLAAVTLVNAPTRRSLGRDEDAAEFLAGVELPTLPADAVICTTWGMATPLWYAALVQTPRPDIRIVNAPLSEWQRLTTDLMHRPMYVTDDLAGTTFWPGTDWQPVRNIWRLKRN